MMFACVFVVQPASIGLCLCFLCTGRSAKRCPIKALCYEGLFYPPDGSPRRRLLCGLDKEGLEGLYIGMSSAFRPELPEMVRYSVTENLHKKVIRELWRHQSHANAVR